MKAGHVKAYVSGFDLRGSRFCDGVVTPGALTGSQVTVPVQEDSVPPTGQKTPAPTGSRRNSSRKNDPAPILPILARRVREVEAKSVKGKVGPTNRVKFQVIALLVRQERARIKADAEISSSARAEVLKRLDGVATILARAAAQDTSLLSQIGRASCRDGVKVDMADAVS